MKIGLIDADLMFGKRSSAKKYGKAKSGVYPNIAIMKLSAYHKAKGDDVSWYNGFEQYDIVYVSKVFSDTLMSNEYINAPVVICGGTGFQIKLVDDKEVFNQDVYFEQNEHQRIEFSKSLSAEVENIYPDYSLYPMIQDTAYGFLSRGCPRGCSFCHVAAKEGRRAYKVNDLCQWWGGQKNIVLQDPNILACPEWRDLLQQLIDSKAKVDINQGLDARLITLEKMQYINKLKLSTVHFAWDDYKQKDAVLKGLKIFAENYKKSISHFAQVFVLVNYDTTFEQDLERIYTLRDMGYDPYIMVYDKSHCKPIYRKLQRWVNARSIFHKVAKFEAYLKYMG